MSTVALENKSGIHPKKLALWLAMASMVMMFASLTSAYIVKQAGGNWEDFKLPYMFDLSTAVILISSGTMHWALTSFRKNDFSTFRLAFASTLALGCIFLFMQLYAFVQLDQIGIYLNGSSSGAFIYIIAGMHGLHIVGGLIAMIWTLLANWSKSKDSISKLMLETNPHKNLKVEMVATYWHFVDIVWIYLFLFFYFDHM